MSKKLFLNKLLVFFSQVFQITQASHAHISALYSKALVLSLFTMMTITMARKKKIKLKDFLSQFSEHDFLFPSHALLSPILFFHGFVRSFELFD
jgi:hypothetical protein